MALRHYSATIQTGLSLESAQMDVEVDASPELRVEGHEALRWALVANHVDLEAQGVPMVSVRVVRLEPESASDRLVWALANQCIRGLFH